MKFTDCENVTHTFPGLHRYRGQDYDSQRHALTVVTVEDTVEVFLVPLGKPNSYDGSRRLLWEVLRDYLEATQTNWQKSHTVFRHTYCNFTNQKQNAH